MLKGDEGLKLVLHLENKVIEVIKGVENLKVDLDKNELKWSNGEISGIKAEFIVIPDDIGVNEGDEITEELINSHIGDERLISDEKKALKELEERAIGMQEVDDFTLMMTSSTEERTTGMQEIDDYTLMLVMELMTEIDTLKERITILEGGNV